MPRSMTYTALGAYIYAGGFTVGVKSAGFKVLAHLEDPKPYGSATVRLNYPDLPIHGDPVSWPVDSFGGVDFIYGNPPCAAWSGNNSASHKEDSWKIDPRVNCTRNHFTLLGRLKPKVWAWESVCNAPAKGKALVDELTGKAMAMGYSVTQVFHDAMYLGVPQTRKRWFFVAHRIKLNLEEPNWDGVTTAAQALKKIKPVGPPAYDSRGNKTVFAPVLKDLKPGMRLRKFWESVNPDGTRKVKANGHTLGRPGFGHMRLHPDKVATATVGYSMVHPVEHRFMSVNEVAVIAGFPQEYRFAGGELGAQQLDLIARGVCPPVGAWLARSVMSSLKANVRVTKSTATVIDFRKCPSAA